MSFEVKIEYFMHDEQSLGVFPTLSLAQDFVQLWFLGQFSIWTPQEKTLLDLYPQEYEHYRNYYKKIHSQWKNGSEFLIIAERLPSNTVPSMLKQS